MLAKQYIHRLPADYDVTRIRERAATRGPHWDAVPGLGFKALTLRERTHGAVGSSYGLFYLWLDAAAAADFAMGEGFQTVIDGFGRPSIDVWLPLDARRGPAADVPVTEPAWLVREFVDLSDVTDHIAARRDEVEHNRTLAARPTSLAAISAVDVSTWRIVRLHLSVGELAPDAGGTAWELLYFARPGLDQLAGGGT